MCNRYLFIKLSHRVVLGLIWLGLLFSMQATAGTEQLDADTMLRAADSYRLGSDQARVVTEVSEYQQQTLLNQRRYHVYINGNNSLVMFKSAAESGQKMLMLGQQYWLIMPRSSRPIRITPMQKLLGQASIGDIATLTWHRDYDITAISAAELMIDGKQYACQQLTLSARADSNSYQSITLWISQQDNFPLQAAFYLTSGKLAKMAQFTAGELNGERRVVTMRLQDKLQPQKLTEVRYLDISQQALPASYFNPAFLTRTALEQL